jgi:hypothetical protein
MLEQALLDRNKANCCSNTRLLISDYICMIEFVLVVLLPDLLLSVKNTSL